MCSTNRFEQTVAANEMDRRVEDVLGGGPGGYPLSEVLLIERGRMPFPWDVTLQGQDGLILLFPYRSAGDDDEEDGSQTSDEQ